MSTPAKERMIAKRDDAVAAFLDGYNCAQSVLFAFCGDLGLAEDVAMKSACGFGAGMGRTQGVCGAITGGIIAIGLKHGRARGGEKASTEESYRRVRELMARFELKRGSCSCRILLHGCDLSTSAGQQYFREKGLQGEVCTACVTTAVDILEDVL